MKIIMAGCRWTAVLLTIIVAGCALPGLSDKNSEQPFVTKFGDVTNRDVKGIPEREEHTPVQSPAERRRMVQFLEASVPKKGILKTLETPWGDTIDCVAIQMQPALLKKGMEEHKLERAPRGRIGLQELAKLQDVRDSKPAVQEYALLPEICPEESIPIRRLTIKELARFHTLKDFLARHSSRINAGDEVVRPEDLPEAGPTDKHQYAAGRRYVDNWGAGSVLNVCKPYTESSDEGLEIIGDELRAVVRDDPRPNVWEGLLCALHDDLDILLGHPFPNLVVDDVPAVAIEQAAQVIEDP